MTLRPSPPIHEDDEFLNDHHLIATLIQHIATDTEKEEILIEYNDDVEQAYTDTNQ